MFPSNLNSTSPFLRSGECKQRIPHKHGDGQTDRHDLFTSEFHADQEYIYLIGSLKLAFECCKRYDKMGIPTTEGWRV